MGRQDEYRGYLQKAKFVADGLLFSALSAGVKCDANN